MDLRSRRRYGPPSNVDGNVSDDNNDDDVDDNVALLEPEQPEEKLSLEEGN